MGLTSRRPRSSDDGAAELVTVQVVCREGEAAYKVLWEPTGDEFVINPGDNFTFTFKGTRDREDWADIAMGVGADGVYLGGENLDQHEVTKNGEVIWS
jgi:hypothetical protein